MQRRRGTGEGFGARGRGPTTPRSLERARREMSHLLVVLYRPGNFLFVFTDKKLAWLTD